MSHNLARTFRNLSDDPTYARRVSAGKVGDVLESVEQILEFLKQYGEADVAAKIQEDVKQIQLNVFGERDTI